MELDPRHDRDGDASSSTRTTYLREHLTEGAADAAASGTGLGDASSGHVHLSVGDIASAREFYVDRLGFETTASMGDSALVRVGGRLPPPHGDEHVEQRGRRPARPRTRPRHGRDLVPTADDLGALGERMSHYGVATRDDGAALAFDDPWANLVEVRAGA